MTSDTQLEGLRDRIRYWEGVRDDARSIAYSELRSLANTVNTTQGTGPKSEDKVRAAIIRRATLRLDTLYTELGNRMMVYRDLRGLRW